MKNYRIWESPDGTKFRVQRRRETVFSWIVRQTWMGLDSPDTPLKSKWSWLKDCEGTPRTFTGIEAANRAIEEDVQSRKNADLRNWKTKEVNDEPSS